MAITRERKEELVEQYAELLERTNGFIVIHYSGMSVNAIADLRGKIREADGQYLVTKNTLFRRALEQQGWQLSDELLTGPIAVAFGMENFPGVAKTVLDYIKDYQDRMQVKGGMMTGEVIDSKKVETISELPSMEEMRAQLAGLVVQPATGLVSILNSATGELVNVLQAYINEKGEGEAA